jgi:hypothetical protein
MNAISPYTGWTRVEWAALADRLLAAVRPYASPNHARVNLPGPRGGYGEAIDGLEGFARTFLLAGFRLAGEPGIDPQGLAQWYAEGIAAGTDPRAPDRWVRLDEHPQARVEAASIAIALDMSRPWIWDRLDPAVRRRVLDYLAPAAGDLWYPRINWIWFRLVVQTFLRSVGGPHDPARMAADLATHDSFVRADGWLADGDERSYDHYVGWALHLYPTLWARMAGAADLAAPRVAADVARLDRYLLDALRLVGADGAPLAQGRSLVYRFAAAASFWAGALAGVPSSSPGALRRAASGIARHFVEHGAPDASGLLSLGWFDEWAPLRQRYSGTGSPYWAANGMLGLALPATHEVWTVVEEPLPVEAADQLFAIRAPGWVVSATRADGVVRVSNHGTDHAVENSDGGDSPLYARLGYSTVTFPLLDESAWTRPLDQSVALVDSFGAATHRSGMRTLAARLECSGKLPVGLAASVQQAHWLDPAPEQQHHGSGYVGTTVPAATITTVSLLRRAWEIRLVRIEDVVGSNGACGPGVRLRLGGWSVSGEHVRSDSTDGEAMAEAAGIVSRIRAISPVLEAATAISTDASPLGRVSATPSLTYPVEVGSWVAAVIELTKAAARPPSDLTTCTLSIGGSETQLETTVRWPDGVETHHHQDLIKTDQDLFKTSVPELRPATSPGPHNGPTSVSEAR